MAKTTQMSLLELIVLKQDISSVIEYIGKAGSFQFQTRKSEEEDSSKDSTLNLNSEYYNNLNDMAKKLGISLEGQECDLSNVKPPVSADREQATKILASFAELEDRKEEAAKQLEKITNTYKETLAFANLKVSYSELNHLSFICLQVLKLDPKGLDELKEALTDKAIIVPLGEDKSYVLVACTKANQSVTEEKIKKSGAIKVEIAKDFKGVPQNVIDGLTVQKAKAEEALNEITVQEKNFAETHKDAIQKLLMSFTVGVQISDIEKSLEATDLVYRITGWLPKAECETYMKALDNITEGRIAIREYEPFEVPGVVSGKEKVPVKLTHGKFVKSFERMIFSYGSPLYGTIDPTPFVAIFFTLLFGIMFGDLGQGLVFVLMGILMAKNVIKVGGWNKFAPIFMAIGISSSIMGLLTGEFFSDEVLLEPFAEWVTGLFGHPHAPIIKMMPSSDPSSIKAMFGVFGFAVAVGFVINTIGLLINIINNFILKKYDEAIFGKNGLAGAIFFWYVIILVLRIFLFKHSIAVYDWVILGVSLFLAAFAQPFERAIRGERPLLENGVGTYLISGIVELIEVISGYLSNTVSFVRVGAFALSHAVLDFLILTLTNMCGGAGSIGGILVLIFGNAIIIVLEGMIVAIQVIRLQYYEFFSKFFHETGREFVPFKFEIK